MLVYRIEHKVTGEGIVSGVPCNCHKPPPGEVWRQAEYKLLHPIFGCATVKYLANIVWFQNQLWDRRKPHNDFHVVIYDTEKYVSFFDSYHRETQVIFDKTTAQKVRIYPLMWLKKKLNESH